METYFSAVKLSVASVSVVGNFLTLIAHIIDPFRVFRNVSSTFVFNITVIDFISAFLWTIGYFLDLIYAKTDDNHSVHFFYGAVRVSSMSGLAYFSLALELYFSISRPLWHLTRITHKVCRYWIIVTWLFHWSFSEVFTRVFMSKDADDSLFIVFYNGVFFVLLQSLNLTTFISLKKQGQALRNQHRQAGETTSRALKTRYENEKRFLVTVAILSILVAMLYLPYSVIIILIEYKNSLQTISKEVFQWLHFISILMVIINGMANPFFYLWRLPKYKKTFRRLYCECLK